jgi:hypothetical protein
MSFKDSKIAAAANSAMTLSAELAVDTEEYTLCTDGRYEVYTKYQDNAYSTVDNLKNIAVDATQINIMQEENSQYMPFRIPRYWDGMDLMDMLIQIRYESVAEKKGKVATVINVASNNTYIRFGWLIDAAVTANAGDIIFEIMATGVNEKGNNYIWRTRPNGKFTVLQGLNYDGIIEPSEDWYTSFVNMILGHVAEAKQYADEAKASAASINVDDIKANVKTSVMNDLNGTVTESLKAYYTKTEVDTKVKELNTAISGIDSLKNLKVEYDNTTGNLVFKDGTELIGEPITINSLANLIVEYSVVNGKGSLVFKDGETIIQTVELSSIEPSAEWRAALKQELEAEMDEKDTVISNRIGPLETAKTEIEKNVNANTTAVSEIKTTISNIEKKVESATTKSDEAKNAVDILKQNMTSYDTQFEGINTDITDVKAAIEEIKKNPAAAEYDVTYENSIFTFLKDGEIQKSFKIEGGGGSSSDTTTITIERITNADAIFLLGSKAIIEYSFSSVDNTGDTTGAGTATWRVGSTTVATTVAAQGKNSFDITQYLKNGANSIRLSITDSFGTIATKTWTITIVDFKIESIFDDTLFYSDEVTFRYTPYGDINKTVHFVLDGKEIAGVETTASGRQMTYTLAKQSHGAHLLKVYMTASINNQDVTSESVYKDIIWVEQGNTTPIIGCSMVEFTAKQYNTTSIKYVVYDPEHNPATVKLSVDGKVASTLTVGRTAQIWSYKSTAIGKQSLTISCRRITKILTATIEKLDINVSPVTTNLAFDFNPSGKNNGETDWLKINDNLTIEVSDNFDTTNGGYQVDEDGDTYFCVKAGTAATIPYQLFADDAKKTGKNFKFIYKCTNVKNYEAQVLSCFADNLGYTVKAQEATLKSEQNEISVPYCEDYYMELEFNILPDSEYTEMVMWVDGIPTRVKLYATSDSFTQTNPVGITIGSDDCDVIVYRIKAYTMNLTDDEILDNFIADAKNANEIINRYNRNDILDSSGGLDPDVLAEKCPDLRIIKLEVPVFTTGKKNKVPFTSVQQIYKNGRPVDNWISRDGIHNGQGTSSEYYGDSGRNLELNCKNGFTFADDTTADVYSMDENAIGINYFNVKVNIASSENINNAGLQGEYQEFNPYIRPARKKDPRIRDTMQFYPCVVFLKETDVDNAVEFKDGQWHFYAAGDIGNSKKNTVAQGMDPENHKEFIVEVSNNTDPQCRFLSDDLSNEEWGGDTSFEMRYQNPNCTEEEIQAGRQAWNDLLTWVVNADSETFVKEFEQHFIKDSLLFYYLFTERHTMVDNRAKNTFWHTEDLVHWDLCMDYDNDTAMGNDNEGGLTLTYGYEDTDTIGTKSVFNASDSKVFCYIRDYMFDDLQSMFLQMEAKLTWSANRILNKFETLQNYKPERLWIADMRRKYFRPYEDKGTTSYLEMMNGSKKQQRRQFQKYQEKYIASKYVGSTTTSDVITIRGYTPTNWTGVKPDGTFHIVPYADSYVDVRFGSNLVRQRAKRGQTYTVKSPIAAMNDTEVYVYNASLMQSIGDIAPFYPGYTNFNQGVKMTDILIGSDVEGYQNTNMNDFSIGQNVLLERLNLENLPNLKKTIDLSNCKNLEEFLAEGSGITGVIFAPGGKIETAHLPAIASLTGKNLYRLTDLTIASYANLTTLSLDNCNTLDAKDIINKATGLTRVRVTGINWELDDTTLLDRLAKMTGIDDNGYNSVHSVLIGTVHIPVMRQQRLDEFAELWPDLEITYDSIITQFKVTFVNDDEENTVLDIQYVDKGGNAVDPTTREVNPIPIPTKKSTIKLDYTFKGWDGSLTGIFADRTIKAVYNSKVREYTVKYVSKGLTLQESTGQYGSYIKYEGDTPTYTAEESAYKYNLFKGWDKSGFVDGNKTINAVYETCEYVDGYFDGKDLANMTQVELYTLMKMGLETKSLSLKDTLDFKLGVDYSYGDIEEHEVISVATKFDGTNYIDTGLKIMEKDRDFTIAIDFEFDSGNSVNSTLAQCFQGDGSNGFRLWYSQEPRFSWNTDSITPSAGTNREIIVFRHEAGSQKLYVYNSNMTGKEVSSTTLNAIRIPEHSSTLVFGCSKADDGAYENFAKGTIHWAKVWYADLGEEQCMDIAAWIHEVIPMEVAKFKGYYLSDVASKRANITFVASNLLGTEKPYNNKSTNAGGWADSTLNTWLNTRMVKAISPLWKALIKPVKVYSSIGNKSNDTSVSNCRFYVPSLYEIDPTATSEPYISETNAPIAYFTDDDTRKKANSSTPTEYKSYWTRSPNATVANWLYTVNEAGGTYGFSYPGQNSGILLMFSISSEG